MLIMICITNILKNLENPQLHEQQWFELYSPSCLTLYYCVWYHEALRTILKILLIIITGRAVWLCS